MAVTYNATVKNSRLTQVLNAIDAGAGAGILELLHSDGTTVLAQITLNKPCGTVATGVLTFDVDPVPTDGSANATGTATTGRITDSAGVAVVTGLTVGTSGTDIVIGNTSITLGQAVNMTAGSISHA